MHAQHVVFLFCIPGGKSNFNKFGTFMRVRGSKPVWHSKTTWILEDKTTKCEKLQAGQFTALRNKY